MSEKRHIEVEEKDFERVDTADYILIKRARVNNLKNLSVAIPRNKLIVVTGLSGSGKSSLAFDTLYAEGQRMYVESLSSYARQFLGRMEKPEVDYIKGVSPAIAIEQKVNTRNSRSTVGTSTEIYDYLKLLFARIGITYSPISGQEVKSDSVTDIVDFLMSSKEGEKYQILYPFSFVHKDNVETELSILLSKGYTRLISDSDTVFLEDAIEDPSKIKNSNLFVLIDRGVITHDEETQYRLADSVQTALYEGNGYCEIELNGSRNQFSDKFELDGMTFQIPSVNLFSFNNPYGACRTCEGFGKVLGIDEDLVIPDTSLSIYEGAVAPWRSETMKKWQRDFINGSSGLRFPIHKPIRDLTSEQYQQMWSGTTHFKGIDQFFKFLESKAHKIQYRVLLSRYRGRRECPDCRGTRIRKDASYVKINDRSITDLVLLSVTELGKFFQDIEVSEHHQQVANRLLTEIRYRIDYLNRVGLGYLNLNRMTSTLSGGEYQRIKLATSLGSALVGSMYILDEPSIGLHPRDTSRLISVLESLRDLGNTVVVVEHEEDMMRKADQIIDIGPDAGSNGGELIFQGNIDQMNGSVESHTARYLRGAEQIETPKKRRKFSDKIIIKGARENNLKNIDVEIPMGVLTTISGVSGSGKSTLVRKILHHAVGKNLGTVAEATGKFDRLDGAYKKITRLEFVDQNPIGKSSRSNPMTYSKAYDPIRQLFANQPLSKKRGYKPAHFSFNVEGGRCETCQGEGTVRIEMQFMADILLTCDSCKGKRFKSEVLEVKYNDKSIADVLELTVAESMDFFSENEPIKSKLRPLLDVGLGYIRLGQSSNSLSGGEAQRVKLASFLGKGEAAGSEHILFIFDEPTTGLHFHDINKLLDAINSLVDLGHTAVVIEHNMEVVKCADWVIDLGPEGGEHGGEVVAVGTPEQLAASKKGITYQFLAEKL